VAPTVNSLWAISLAALLALILVLAPAAAADRKPPRIVAAAMLDADLDSRADRVRLTYSERVRHRVDRDGRYPFAVSGYRIRSVGKAAGKTLLVLLVEKAQPDPSAAPAIRYRRTSAQPVQDKAGNQAVAQLFSRTKAHGRAPAPPAPADADGDGTPDADDCAPRDASIHPGAADTPDLDFVDSNCDGIDGTEKDAIFVSPSGNDANPGTKAKPKRELQAALATILAGNGRYVLVAFGTYARVKVASGIGIYGGYDPSSWIRRDRFPDGLPLVSGSPEGVLAVAAKDVVLQHLRIRGLNAGSSDRSAYGIRALGNSSLTLQRVAVSAGDGAAGLAGASGRAGERGGAGRPGGGGNCDGGTPGAGGIPGSSPTGRTGGGGGRGGADSIESDGSPGFPGQIGTPGGAGGKKGNPGKPGGKGASGENGSPGRPGAGGTSAAAGAEDFWVGRPGSDGGVGRPGNGGGGGGGGGPQVALFAKNGDGNGGGGGGGGASGGTGGRGGGAGGGSFGLYLLNSKVVVEGSSIAAGNGGAGGGGGDGGFGGAGGVGGKGGKVCTSEIGAGGDGGFGGAGGRGGGAGGGAGGPSIGIFRGGTSTATLKGASKSTGGTPGAGGAGGGSGPGGVGGAGAAGIAKPVYP